MADPDHVAIAKSGSNAISRWREMTFFIPNERPTIYNLTYSLGDRSAGETFEQEFIHGRPKLDLSGAYLSGARLMGADLARDDLSRADLTGSNLRRARLSGANLQSAYVSRSNLSYADLNMANLSGCSLVRSDLSNSDLQHAILTGADLGNSDLSYANLQGSNLAGADLSNADLSWANLNGANLRGARLTATVFTLADLTNADLRGATLTNANLESAVMVRSLMGFSRLVNCDLSQAIGLDSARHSGPSAIGLDTVARSGGRIPRAFLVGAGVAEPMLSAQEAMLSQTRVFPSVLIVGASQDGVLVDRLKSGLASAHIPAWAVAADDEDAIQSGEILLEHTPHYDYLALLCSEASLESPQASTYLAQLADSQRQGSGQGIVTLACCEAFYQRDDHLCTLLRNGQVMDFRGWDEGDTLEHGLPMLVSLLSTKRY